MSKVAQELICIACPVGCSMLATKIDDIITVTGNRCKIGIRPAEKEMTDPRRVLTTSVRVRKKNGYKMLSVKTNGDIPKGKLFICLNEIKALEPEGDYVVGEILIKNVLDTGVDVVATRAV